LKKETDNNSKTEFADVKATGVPKETATTEHHSEKNVERKWDRAGWRQGAHYSI